MDIYPKIVWLIAHYEAIWLVACMLLSAAAALAMHQIFMKHQVPRLKEARLARRTAICNFVAAVALLILDAVT